jgi:hypothetical protein
MVLKTTVLPLNYTPNVSLVLVALWEASYKKSVPTTISDSGRMSELVENGDNSRDWYVPLQKGVRVNPLL